MRLENWQSLFLKEEVENPNFLIFFRIAMGVLLIFYFYGIQSNLFLFVNNPLISAESQRMLIHYNTIDLDQLLKWGQMLHFDSQNILRILFVVIWIAVVLLLIGLFSQWAAFFLLIISVAIQSNGYYFLYGADSFIRIALFYLILFPADRYFTIRNRFRTQNTNTLTPYKRLFQIHLAIAYFFLGLNKAISKDWWNGEDMWKSLHSYYSQPLFDIDFLGDYPSLFVLLGILTVSIELLYPIGVWFKKTRKYTIFLIICLHLFILWQMNLYLFSTLMIILNITCFCFADKNKVRVGIEN